ncbi:cytidylate kinase family protein [Patescibacteria group bacterium]|nr:cytidylate kinase family protein [Patescibacteria group bacterium]
MGNDTLKKYRIITVSGKIAVGTTTLSKNLAYVLNWKHVNFGALQRDFDRKNNINENQQGATARSDDHEREIEALGETMLQKDKDLIYEAWLSGFLARNYRDVFKVLLVCSNDAIRIDRVANRENIAISDAKLWMKQREIENEKKWKKLYGDHNFWDEKNFNLVVDTYKKGPMETLGKVLDRLNYKHR